MTWKIAAIAVSFLLSIQPAIAQSVIADDTLGSERSRVLEGATLNGTPITTQINGTTQGIDAIVDGARRGNNLFHSFREFGVPVDRGVYFVVPDRQVQNVLARVTGKNPSEILGRLGTFQVLDGKIVGSSATLFLINPNGILFGQDASLDLNGSFVATTANAVGFGENRFSATNPQPVPDVLTVNPSAFLFNQLPSGDIVVRSNRADNEGTGLQAVNGQRLTLLGRNVNLEGAQLNAWGGRVEIGAIAKTATIGLSENGQLTFPEGVGRGDVALSNNARVDVALIGKGDIGITANNIALDRSTLAAGIDGIGSTTESQAGDVDLNATGIVKLSSKSRIGNDVNRGYTGNGGNITMTTGSLALTGESSVSASVFGSGKSGNVTVKATDRISLSSTQTAIFTRIEPEAEGKSGDLLISTNILELNDASQISASTLSKGNAGDVTIQVTDRISLSGNQTAIFTSVGQDGNGKGGNLSISTNVLELTDGAQLVANTSGTGNAGNVTIRATNRVSLSDAAIFSNVRQGGNGKGGNLSISTDILELTNGSQFIANTLGTGDAGNVTIQATGRVSLSDAAIFSGVELGGSGKGGNLFIFTNRLDIVRGAQLLTSTFGNGDAGSIVLGTLEQPIASISISGTDVTGISSGLFASTGSDRLGGNIHIFAHRFRLSDGAVVDARTDSSGSSGTITLTANLVEIVQGGQFLATTQGSGSANQITINAEQLLISGTDPTFEQRRAEFANRVSPISPESGIYTRSFSTGSAGSIFITASNIQLNDRARIDTQSATVDGGNITITALDRLILRNNSQISATAGTAQKFGNGGNININARFLIAVPKENSDITADAFQGNGGRITLSIQRGLFGFTTDNRSTNLSDLTATSQDGISGTVTVNTPNTTNLQNSLTQLTQSSIDSSTLLSNSCIARNPKDGTFYVTGSEGFPAKPGDLSTYATGTVRPTWKPGDAIVEPQRTYRLPNGKLLISREC